MSTSTERLPTLEADRVRLRWLSTDDIPALFEVFSDSEVTRYWSSPPMKRPEAAVALLGEIHDSFHEGTLFQWGVALRETDQVVGTCTLASIDKTNRRAEIGFALGSDHWRHGYMSEAVETLLRFALGPMDLHRIEADIDPRNAASIRLIERFGFQREGFLRERWIVGGEITDTVMYGLLQREWKARAS